MDHFLPRLPQGPSDMEPEGDIETNCDTVVEKFDDMNLKESLLRGIYAYGWVCGVQTSWGGGWALCRVFRHRIQVLVGVWSV